jgi:cardiolipin synthase
MRTAHGTKPDTPQPSRIIARRGRKAKAVDNDVARGGILNGAGGGTNYAGVTGASPAALPTAPGVDVTIPNFITVLRFFLVPAIVFALLTGHMGWAFAGFVVAGVSDGVDGFIARQFDQRSKLGAYLDPIADKLLLVSTFVVLGYMGELPLWLVIAAVSRDALIIGAVLLSTIMGQPVEVRPLFVSKANTAVQIILAGWALAELAQGRTFGPVRQWLVYLSGILTVASAAAYLVGWLKHMAGHAESETSNG